MPLSRGLSFAATIVIAAGALSAVVTADHAWSTYHWLRSSTSSEAQITVINSTTSDWDGFVAVALDDWSRSSVLDMVEDANGSTESTVRRKCAAPDGQVRICNLAYGQNGWLGIAGISIDPNGHITKGYTKLNDTYFAMSYYNKASWKQSVTCQELGHNVGLGHQDENFNNQTLLSCMDYQDPPYPAPNDHDYEQLESIYNHADTSTGGGGCKGRNCAAAAVAELDEPAGWGISLGRRGAKETFLRIDPDGTRHLTHVTWAIGVEGGRAR